MIMFCHAENVHKKKQKYKSTIKIPFDLFQVIKPVFTGTDLYSDDLISQCLHGQK